MTTDKQVTANQNNALKSTGPKSKPGKEVVAKNALKHGILSLATIEEAAKLGEEKDNFNILKQDLVNDLKPVGMIEEMLVDKLVSCYWRLRRVIRAENGALRLQTDNLLLKETMKLIEQANDLRRFSLIRSQEEKKKNSFSAKYLLDEYTDLKGTVEEIGYLPEEALKKYIELKNLADDESELKWIYFFNETALGKVEEEPDKEKGKKAIIYCLEKDIAGCKIAVEVDKDMEKDQIAATELSLSIPLGDSADKLLRYETALENQLYRAMNQLIKLQLLRNGGKVLSIRAAEIEGMEL